MKPLAAFVLISFCLLAQPACADCADINRQASVWRAAFVLAKDDYTRGTATVLGKPFSEEAVAIVIASNVKMKIVIDGLIEILERSLAEGCHGANTAVWRDIIDKLKVERDAIERTIQSYLGKRDGNAQTPD